MKLKKNLTEIFLISIIISFTSIGCDSFLNIAAPKTELASATVFTNNSTANAAITSIYARMSTVNGTPFSNLPWLTGLSADEFTNFATNQNVLAFYSNSLNALNPNMASYFWTPYYNMIYQANSIMEGLEKGSAVSSEVQRQIKGEALFIRAFYHFYLTNLFGDIPIITSTDYKANAILPRASQVDVYKQIITDLTDAKAVLNPAYVGADGLIASIDRVRPNLATAQALLARVYLYTKQYEKAEAESTLVISNPTYILPVDLSTVFLKSSTEAIWQTQPVPNMTTTFADKFVLTGNPSTGLSRSITLSPSLWSLFETDDLRIDQYMGSRTYQGNTIRFVRKHKVTSANNSEYNMILRLAEQYLIRAEARIHLQMIEEGIEDLNSLRRRANVNEYDYQTISNPLLLVEQERQRELFAEGHRWFDVRRTDRIDAVMTGIAPTKGGVWTEHSALYPIPETERTNNPQLSQNKDY